jgi:hypothetical protein
MHNDAPLIFNQDLILRKLQWGEIPIVVRAVELQASHLVLLMVLAAEVYARLKHNRSETTIQTSSLVNPNFLQNFNWITTMSLNDQKRRLLYIAENAFTHVAQLEGYFYS